MSTIWNICINPTNPSILLPVGVTPPEGYTIEMQTSNPHYLVDMHGEKVDESRNRRITVFAFRNRFTNAEKIAIEMASIDDPQASPQMRQFAAALRVSVKDADNADFIDLDWIETRNGVLALETYGAIGAGRALAVLDAPLTQKEIPQ